MNPIINIFNNTAWMKLVYVGIIVILGFVLFILFSKAIKKATWKLHKHQAFLLKRVFTYAYLILWFILIFNQLGFSLSVLLGTAGILTLTISFAAQTSISQIISGIFLIAEKPFKVGDVIETSSIQGEVLSIDLLSVKLKTPEQLFVRIPNETLLKNKLINYSRIEERRVDIRLYLNHACNLDQIETLLIDLCNQDSHTLKNPNPIFVIEAIHPGATQVLLASYTYTDYIFEYQKNLNKKIHKLLNENKIALATPNPLSLTK